MKIQHWLGTLLLIVVVLYVGKYWGSKLPAIPGIGG